MLATRKFILAFLSLSFRLFGSQCFQGMAAQYPSTLIFVARKLSENFLAVVSIKVLRTYFPLFLFLRDFHLTLGNSL